MADQDHAALHLMPLAYKAAAQNGHHISDFGPIAARPDGSLTRTASCACGAKFEILWRAGAAAPTLQVALTECPGRARG
jgi:hypothetical protein